MTAPALERGVFTLSLDFELIWGTLDLFGPERFRRVCEREREVVPRLLDLLREFGISATWCVLGHLFLETCAPEGGRAHAGLVRPRHAWCPGDWFASDTGGTEETRPTFYAHSLLRQIRSCPVPQEVGSHSFSHVIFGDEGCSEAVAESEVAACVAAARDLGIELRSFAFPRNSVGHLGVWKRHGFRCYRGPEPVWYEQLPVRTLRARLAHLWDVVRAAEPPTVLPERVDGTLWNVPGSMIYFPAHGVRRLLPVSRRALRALRGLEAAARERRVFHLWFHPTNLADATDAMMGGLRTIFERAASLRDRSLLDIRPMGALVA
ncbi:MAG TPA: polysaccharide deacetylase family protein [Vicinamibacteria bacterium]